MANAWADFMPWVLPFCPGVPDAVAESAVRDAAIEFCGRTRVLRVDMTAISLVVNQPTYAVATPAGTVVSDVIALQCGGLPMSPKTPAELDIEAPTWRALTAERPSLFHLENERLIRVVAIPTVAFVGGITGKVAIKPAVDAVDIDSRIYEEYRRAIAAGALAHLLCLPKKSWTDEARADRYEGKFNDAIVKARNLARKGFVRNKSLSATPREYGY